MHWAEGGVEAVSLLDSHFFIVKWMLTLAGRMVVRPVLEYQSLLKNHPQGLAPGCAGLSDFFPAPTEPCSRRCLSSTGYLAVTWGPEAGLVGGEGALTAPPASPRVPLWEPQDRKQMSASPVILSCVLWCLRTFPLGVVLKMVCVGAVLL